MDEAIHLSLLAVPLATEVDTLATLRQYAHRVGSESGLGEGEERDSSHYVDETYFLWEGAGWELSLFWADEHGLDGWVRLHATGEAEAVRRVMSLCRSAAERVSRVVADSEYP